MQRNRQYYIQIARQKKARALSSTILDLFADQARNDVEGLIGKLAGYTSQQWARLAALASTNPPSMATCQIVFVKLRARRAAA